MNYIFFIFFFEVIDVTILKYKLSQQKTHYNITNQNSISGSCSALLICFILPYFENYIFQVMSFIFWYSLQYIN